MLGQFQYISCYSLSLWQRFSLLYKSIVSIHLMLLFIIFWRHCYFQFHLFQYISCYSLSGSTWQTETLQKFQYISCYSLSVSESDTFRTLWTFQYISCYSLSNGKKNSRNGQQVSIHLMLLFISIPAVSPAWPRSFNTSHVTLYLRHDSFIVQKFIRFNTSHVTLYLVGPTYISGSCACFNTSHVTLYPISSFGQSIVSSRFNTSHVTLYPGASILLMFGISVSIHLMLLFIGSAMV